MRIDHVVPHYYPDVGGVETHVGRLSEYLVAHGHEVVVHTSRVSSAGRVLAKSETVGGVAVRRYAPVFRLGYYATLFRPRIEAADVVHLHGYAHLSNDWTARKVHDRFPIALSLHHGVAQPAPSRRSRMERGIYDPLFGRRSLALADAIIAASEADLRWLEARGHRASLVQVIPTGLEAAAYLPGNPERARRAFGLGRYVLFLGRLHQEKSIDDLVRAFAGLGSSDVSVVLVGPDAGAKRGILDLAMRLGMANRIKTVGEVDPVAKRDLLAGCEALVLPSFYEAQGIVLLEAWAQSRPVVASAVGGVPFLVSHGRDGLLYPHGDTVALASHIRQLLDDPSAALRMGVAGREKAKGYALDRLAPRFLEVYDRLRALGARRPQVSGGPTR